MRYPDTLLDQIRQALPVFDLVQKHFKLRKAGSAEYVAIDDKSLTVNTSKNIWQDFGKGQAGGDIFAFEMFVARCTFQEAVERCAQIAGVALPSSKRKSTANGHTPPVDDAPPVGDAIPAGQSAFKRAAPDFQITCAYDYVDADGLLVYQTYRREWVEDGKRKKTFGQRRPDGAIEDNRDDQKWIWGLTTGVYLRNPRNGDLYRANNERLKNPFWANAERVDVQACAHMLYRLPELREELAESAEERRTIFVCEGEKDCDTLNEWGCVATTNSGGAENWRDDMAEQLRGADVVVLIDNDEAGIKRGHKVAASLKDIASRVRSLRWPEFWPECPDKADVTDWRDQASGDAAKFFEIVEQLRDWTPERPTSAFSAVRYAEIDRATSELQWTIKGVLQRATVSLWYGATQSGKSFLLTDAAMSIARAQPWMGHRTKGPGLVVYQTGEGGVGFRQRLKAYRQHHKLEAETDLPFVYLPARINLFQESADVDKLIGEIKSWSDFYDHPLELVAIDTFNAASGGANENSNQDVGLVLERCRKIVDSTGAHVALVHHTPASGDRPRGHSSLLADVETAIAVSEDAAQRDEDGRPLRIWKLTKQKDGPSSISRSFVLRGITLSHDQEGDAITSCVVEQIGTAFEQENTGKFVVPEGWAQINHANLDIFRSLVRAISKHGAAPPPEAGAPVGEQAVKVGVWEDMMIELLTGHEDITPTVRKKIKQRIWRASLKWGDTGGANLIGKGSGWVWRTSRKVFQIDRIPDKKVERLKEELDPILAPGEDMADLLSNTGGGDYGGH